MQEINNIYYTFVLLYIKGGLMKKLIVLLFACVLLVGCGKNNNDDVNSSNDKKNSSENVTEKVLKKGEKVKLDGKKIMAFHLMEDEFVFPKTGESTKRVFKDDKDIPITFDLSKGFDLDFQGVWYEIDENYDYKKVATTSDDYKFEKGKDYSLQLYFLPKDGYELVTRSEINNDDLFYKSFLLNGASFSYYSNTRDGEENICNFSFIFPKTK